MPRRDLTERNECEAIRILLDQKWTHRRIATVLKVTERTIERRVAEMRAAEVPSDAVRLRPRLCAAS